MADEVQATMIPAADLLALEGYATVRLSFTVVLDGPKGRKAGMFGTWRGRAELYANEVPDLHPSIYQCENMVWAGPIMGNPRERPAEPGTEPSTPQG